MKIFKLMLFICGLILITAQAFAAEVALDPATKIVSQGQTFNLNVTIDPIGTRIAGAQANIGFNSSLFRVNNISEGDLFNRNGTNTFFNAGTTNNSAGTAINIFNAIIGNRNVTTSGTFIIINVTAIGITGTSGFDLSNVKISDTNGLAVSLNATNGSFTISAPAAEVALNPSTKIVSQGETFNLNVTIDPIGTRIAGAQANIGFNSSLFRVNNISEGDLFNRNGTNTFFNAGTINNSTGMAINIFNAIIGNRNVTTSGTFIIINVTAIGITGTSGFDLSNMKISDPNGLAVTLNTTNGRSTISAPVIYVVTPDGGETWIRGTSNKITWNSTGIPGTNVKLELLKNGSAVGTVNPSTPNDGSYVWSITSTRAPGTDYKIRVTSTSNPAYKDTSDNNFTIGGINVKSPNGGETWIRGTSNMITWNSEGIPGPNVKLELLKNGSAVGTIIPSTPNDGSHAWSITSTRAPGTDYKVRVTSTSNSVYKDISDNNFTIISK